jgi:hypothetical protein
MTSLFSNMTVLASSDAVPERIEQFDDVADLFDEASSAACVCSSRNWMAEGLGKVAKAYAAAAIAYLAESATVLDQPKIEAAIQAITNVLAKIAVDPASFIKITGGTCSEAKIAEALDTPAQLPSPECAPDNDSGLMDPACVIGFLKSHLEVLKLAQESGSCVIHVVQI